MHHARPADGGAARFSENIWFLQRFRLTNAARWGILTQYEVEAARFSPGANALPRHMAFIKAVHGAGYFPLFFAVYCSLHKNDPPACIFSASALSRSGQRSAATPPSLDLAESEKSAAHFGPFYLRAV